MLAPETVLQHRYRIIRPIGEGGMGAVYLATDQRLGSSVALKETFFSDELLRRAFEREARLLAGLRHAALPTVIDHFSEGEGQFLVMNFIPGDDLAAMLKQRGRAFPPEQVLLWADQLLDALDYLHTQEPPIIHRDIKPQNLKLTTRNQIVLLDFGLAKGSVGQGEAGTFSRSVLGYTPNYAPFEQIRGMGTHTRSDLYALAATLYHLLTNVMPPDALTRAAALLNGERDPLRPAHEVNPSLPQAIADLLHHALAQNPSQRPASAHEMRQALGAAKQRAASETRGLTWDEERSKASVVASQQAPTLPLNEPQTRLPATVIEEQNNNNAPRPLESPEVALGAQEMAATIRFPAPGAQPETARQDSAQALAETMPPARERPARETGQITPRPTYTPATQPPAAPSPSWPPPAGYESSPQHNVTPSSPPLPAPTSFPPANSFPPGAPPLPTPQFGHYNMAGRGQAGNRKALIFLVAVVGAVLLLTVVGGGAWWYLRDRDEVIAGNPSDPQNPQGPQVSPSPANTPALSAAIGRVLGRITTPGKVFKVALSPDGSIVATIGESETVHLWQAREGGALRQLRGHADLATSVAFSADGQTVASGSNDGTIRLWRVSDGQMQSELRGHRDHVFKLFFSADGRTLASAGSDRTIRLWQVSDGQALRSFALPGASELIINLSPDLQVVALYQPGPASVRLWSLNDNRLLSQLEGHSFEVTSGAFNADHSILALGSRDGSVRLWRANDGKLIARLAGPQSSAEDVAFDPMGQVVAAGFNDGTIWIWNAGNNSFVKKLEGHARGQLVYTLAFNANGRMLASGSADSTVRLWQIREGS